MTNACLFVRLKSTVQALFRHGLPKAGRADVPLAQTHQHPIIRRGKKEKYVENEAPKVEIRLLIVIGFLLGATLGVGAGFGLAVALVTG